MSRRKKNDQDPKLHHDVSEFSITVDEFGKIQTSIPIDSLNEFLNKNTHDIKINNSRKKRNS